MRNYFLIFVSLISYLTTAQSNYLLCSRKQTLLKSLPNPFSLIVSNENCENYKLSITNGKILKSDSECKFSIIPDSIGVTRVTVFDNKGNEVETQTYRVRDIEFQIRVYGFEYVTEDLNRFCKTARLELFSTDYDGCMDFEWNLSCDLIIIQDNLSTNYKVNSNKGNLTAETKARFESLKSGDLILFNNVEVTIGQNKTNAKDLILNVE